MFLEELTISNVGLFSKQSTIQFAPPEPRRPVVLIGGLNGSGKTTILDAIQLALYGRRARLSNRGNLSYEEYLRRSINKNGSDKPASVVLRFRQSVDGHEQKFQIIRSWKESGRGPVESLTIYRNDALDKVLTDTWTEYVEELIPVEISRLFFFDGEKIESFASYENSAGLVSRAVHSLLGLDVVNTLSSDLITLERNKRISLKNDIERQSIERLQQEISKLDDEREDLSIERASIQSELDRQRKKFTEAENNYNRNGGALFDQRDKIEDELHLLQETLDGLEDQLRAYSESALPLSLVPNLLLEISQQNFGERRISEMAIVGKVIKERDQNLLDYMRVNNLCVQALDSVKQFLDEDRRDRSNGADGFENFLNLSPECDQDLEKIQAFILPKLQESVSTLLSEENSYRLRIIDLERKLAGVPAQDLVKKLAQERDGLKSSVAEIEQRLGEVDSKINRLVLQRNELDFMLVSQLEQQVKEEFDREDAGRMVLHAQLVRNTLDRFRVAMVARHATRIASLVLDSFRRLLRKEFLVSDININPGTFILELYGNNKQIISPERLSAGERQLLAIALLWGLARASGRPLPVVIDTPLGRLDATHRRKLVEDYFPYASHQVILLSTDEEIDEKHYKKLEPFIGHSYHLEFDDKSGSTEVKPGYFW